MKRFPRSATSIAVGACLALSTQAMETEERELSLSDLMGLQNAIGTLTRMERNKVPVSVTTINEEDIRLTPARNLLDLVEALVPGAMWADHPEQARLGMRGIIVDRNYKFLLLVDGHIMNQKTHSGVVSEIQTWDMNDIKQIEIIRGPGSVTYGPGAVSGVIAISTKHGEDAEGFRVSTQSVVPYGSQGTTLQYGKVGDGWSMYSYLNATWTEGYEGSVGFSENGTTDLKTYSFGQVGTSAHTNATRSKTPNAVLSDYARETAYMPQIQAHLGATLPMGFETWARYTQGGTTTGASLSKLYDPDSNLVDSRTFMYRQATGSVHHQYQFTPDLGLASKLEAGSQDYERYSGSTGDTKSLTSPLNTTHNFAESDITAQTLLNATFLEKYQLAVGTEYVYSKVGAGWFDEPQAMKLGDGQNIVNGPDSWLVFNDTTKAIPTGMVWGVPYSKAGSKQAVFAGDDGFATHQVSFLGEANLAFSDYFTLLLSGRADKNSLSSWMLSPRVAVVSAINPRNIVKGIWQRSMRMNNLEQMYLEDLGGNVSDPEVLEGFELIYTALPTDQLSFNLSGYHNNVESVGWSTELTKTLLQGTMSLWGSEAEMRWKSEKWSVGLNHAVTYMDEWKLAADQSVSGVSYADMNYKVNMATNVVKSVNAAGKITYWSDSVLLSSTGNSINNWAENITKANLRYKVTPTLTLAASSRILWGFAGYDDQLTALGNATAVAPNDTVFSRHVKPMIDSLVEVVKAEDPYGTQIRLDVAAEWQMSDNVALTGMVQNLAGTGENRRFDYISGLKAATPRSAWVEEPRTFYVKLAASF